jgi:acyl dehydratase
MLVQSIATGLAVQMGIFHGTLVAIAGMDIAWKSPARVGDTLRVTMEVVEVDPSPKPKRGKIRFGVLVQKEDDTVLAESSWNTVVSRRPK